MCRRIGFLEQKLEVWVDKARLTQEAADAPDACAKILLNLGVRGFTREGNESVAELFARAFGISCRQLKDELQSAAMKAESAAHDVSNRRRRR